jgi:Arc/MetJ-type ribon-helix-helix transcriptional regulator
MVPLPCQSVIDHVGVSSRPSPGDDATRVCRSSTHVRSGETRAQRPKTRLDYVRDAIRLIHDSRHREEASVTWITRSRFSHDTRHPQEMEAAEIEAFVTHLAVRQKVSASTQDQALSALLFLCRDVLRRPHACPRG